MADNEVSATKLKSHCGQVLAEVARSREPVLITRRGRPIARLVPVEPPAKANIFGFAKGAVRIHGDIVAPLDVRWEAAE